MKAPIGPAGWLKILTPLVFALVFTLSARPFEFERWLKDSTDPDLQTRALGQILSFEPWRTDALEQLARSKAARQDDKGVIAILAVPASQNRLSAEGYDLLAAAYENSGQLGLTLDIRQKILALQPETRASYQEVFRLQLRLGQSGPALSTLENLLRRFPKDAEGLYQSGLILFAGGEASALTRLEEAAVIDPSYANQLLVVQTAADQAGQSQDEAYRLLLRGRALGGVGAWQLAKGIFEQVVALKPEYAEGWAFLAEAKQQTAGGDGYAELTRAAQLDGGSLTVKGLTALYWRRHRQFDRAVALIAQAAYQEPRLASWQIEWANTLVEEGELRIALKHYQKALELEPADADARYKLAEFCLNYRMDLRETGLPAARQGAVENPADVRWIELLGRIFQALGDSDLARRSLEQAVRMAPGFFPAQLHLGQFYLDQGDSGRAHDYLKAAAGQSMDDKTRQMAARLLKRFYNEEILLTPVEN